MFLDCGVGRDIWRYTVNFSLGILWFFFSNDWVSSPSLCVCSKTRRYTCCFRQEGNIQKKTQKNKTKLTVTSLTTVDYCQWKYFLLRQRDRISLGATAHCCSFCFAQSWHQWDTGGQAIPQRRVRMHYFDSDHPTTTVLLKWQNVQFLLECILQPRMVGHIHSHWVLIMCETIMSQSVASHVGKLLPHPPLRYSMQIGKGQSLRTRSYEAVLGYCSEAAWMASIGFYKGAVVVN